MTSPLSGSIAAAVYSGLKNLFLDGTLTKDTASSNSPDIDSFDPPAPMATGYTCKVMVETYSQFLRAGGTIKANERKVLILTNSLNVSPSPGDRVTVRGVVFTVVEVTADPALATWECRAQI